MANSSIFTHGYRIVQGSTNLQLVCASRDISLVQAQGDRADQLLDRADQADQLLDRADHLLDFSCWYSVLCIVWPRYYTWDVVRPRCISAYNERRQEICIVDNIGI
jgi:hypothetical protein